MNPEELSKRVDIAKRAITAMRSKESLSEQDVYNAIGDELIKDIQGDTKKYKTGGLRRNFTHKVNGKDFYYKDYDGAFGLHSENTVPIDLSSYINDEIIGLYTDKNKPKIGVSPANKDEYPNIHNMETAANGAMIKRVDKWREANNKAYDLNDMIKLTSGKFNGASVPRQLIDDIVKGADAANIDRKTALGLIGQESTFGIGKNPNEPMRKDIGGENAYKPLNLASYWKGIYETPKEAKFHDALSRKGLPIVVDKKGSNKQSQKYMIPKNRQDSVTVETYLSKNPNFVNGFIEKANNYEQPDIDVYKDAFEYYKTGGYNRGDSKHTKDVNNSGNILAKDPALKKYF